MTEVTGVDFDNGTLKTNVVFRLATGNFQFSGESKVFLETMEKLNMSEEEEAWLKGRVELLAKGEGPTTMKPLTPYPLQVSDSSQSLVGI